jgi:hypothetical protein
MGEDKRSKMTFPVFVAGLMAEGLMAVGVMELPGSGKTEKDLGHAEMVIDTLAMLKEKTSGNLEKEEADHLEQVIHQMRMAYVESSRETAKIDGGAKNEK